MKAVIHIGAHKTGTTSIQSFLKENREALRKRKIFIPYSAQLDTGQHHELKAATFDPGMWRSWPLFSFAGFNPYLCFIQPEKGSATEDQKKLWERCRNEIEKNCSKDDTVIFSDENLSLFTEKEVEKVKELMDSLFDEVTIVLYLRRQPEYLVSFHSTWIYHGAPWDIFEYVNMPEERSFLVFHKNVKRWSIFGKDKIKIRVFDRQELHENDLLSDFASTVGFDISGLERVTDKNMSLGDAETEFFRLLNTHIPMMLDPWTHNPDRFLVRNCFDREDWRGKAYIARCKKLQH